MALPKRQHSKQRGRKRRSHDAIKAKALGKCSHCGKPILSHRVCPFCGHYKGAQVVDLKPKKEKKKK